MSVEQDETFFTTVDLEEENLSFFLLEDLIWEYNERIQKSRYREEGKYPLSLCPPKYEEGETVIRPMTEEEIRSMDSPKQRANQWMVTQKVLASQITPAGLIRNTPNILEGIRLKKMIEELGIRGQVIYKETEGRIYVILKGNPRLREVFTGTRYSNMNPKIVKYGLSKVNFWTALKATVKVSFMFYGGAKVVDGVNLYFKDGELTSRFWSEIPADVMKVVISGAAATAAGVGLSAIGASVAVGIGVALVMGIFVDVTLEHVDQETGFTEAVAEATERLVENLKKGWDAIKERWYQDSQWKPLILILAQNRAILNDGREMDRANLRRELFENMLKPQEFRSYIAATEFATAIDPLEGFTYPKRSGRLRVNRYRNISVYTA